MNGRRWTAVVAVLLLYWSFSLSEITTIPLVHEDEPWIAAHAWGLAHDGVFGADMFTGLWRLEARTYEFMPIFALLQAAVLWGAGLSVLTVRYLPLLAGALTIALTLHIGRKNFRFESALLAAVLLIGWRIAGPLPNHWFGIPMMDTVRVARYDALVPVFGLLAWAVYSSPIPLKRGTPPSWWPTVASRDAGVPFRSKWRFGLAGLLAGLAGLTHFYGVFWLVVLLVMAGKDRQGRQAWPALLVGFALPWTAYILYVLSDFASWQQQFNIVASAERFSPFDPAWYGRNLSREPLRYLPHLALNAEGLLAQLRPGVLLLVGLPAAALWHWRSGGRSGRNLLIPLLLLPLLFGLLISPKVPGYLVAFWPVIALAVAAAAVEWGYRAGGWRRLAVLFLFALILAEGGWRLAQTTSLAQQTSSYDNYIGAIQENLPPDGLVIGLQRTWLGLAERDYRSWIVPLFTRSQMTPAALVTAVEQLQPTAVLVDADMNAYFAARPAEWTAIQGWLTANGFGPPVIINDPTYGQTAVYRRPPTGAVP